MQQRVEPLHLADERADVEVAGRSSRARRRSAARSLAAARSACTIRRGQRGGVALGHDPARPVRRSSTSIRPSASVATIGLPIASASNTVSGVPSQSDGNTLRSNAESVAATSFTKPTNTNRSPSPSARACASSAGRSGPSPARKKRASGCRSTHAARGLDEVLVALRVVQPRDGARPRTRPGAMPSVARAAATSVRRRADAAELVERRAEVDDLDRSRPASAARSSTKSAVLCDTAIAMSV